MLSHDLEIRLHAAISALLFVSFTFQACIVVEQFNCTELYTMRR